MRAFSACRFSAASTTPLFPDVANRKRFSRLDPGENLRHGEGRPAARKTSKAASLTVMPEAIAAWTYFGRRIKNDSIGSATNSSIRDRNP